MKNHAVPRSKGLTVPATPPGTAATKRRTNPVPLGRNPSRVSVYDHPVESRFYKVYRATDGDEITNVVEADAEINVYWQYRHDVFGRLMLNANREPIIEPHWERIRICRIN